MPSCQPPHICCIFRSLALLLVPADFCVLICRATKTLMVYLMETNANVYSWLVSFYKEHPIPKVSLVMPTTAAASVPHNIRKQSTAGPCICCCLCWRHSPSSCLYSRSQSHQLLAASTLLPRSCCDVLPLPVLQSGSWDEVSGEAFLRKLLAMPIEEAKYNTVSRGYFTVVSPLTLYSCQQNVQTNCGQLAGSRTELTTVIALCSAGDCSLSSPDSAGQAGRQAGPGTA